MRRIKNKTTSSNKLFLMFLISFVALLNMSAQNYVATGGEFYTGNIGYDFTTSSVWQTDRSANPGYYSWGNGATSYTGLGASNNINGYVKKYGVDAFMFPIGMGTEIRTLSIAAKSLGNATDAYATAWIEGSPSNTPDPTNSGATHSIASVSGAILAVSSLGQWDWQDLTSTGAGLGITVSIPAITATTGVFNQASNLRLVGWDGSVWKAIGTTGASGLTNYSTLSGTMEASIQAIGIGAVCSAGIIYPTIQ